MSTGKREITIRSKLIQATIQMIYIALEVFLHYWCHRFYHIFIFCCQQVMFIPWNKTNRNGEYLILRLLLFVFLCSVQVIYLQLNVQKNPWLGGTNKQTDQQHCSKKVPIIGTVLAFWVHTGPIFIFQGPYFQCFGFIHAKNVNPVYMYTAMS